MTSDVIAAAMAERLGLITHQAPEFDLLSGEEDHLGSAIAARKIERVGPDQKQSFTGRGKSVAGGRPAGMRAGAQARTHGHGCEHGRAGAGGAKVRMGEVEKW